MWTDAPAAGRAVGRAQVFTTKQFVMAYPVPLAGKGELTFVRSSTDLLELCLNPVSNQFLLGGKRLGLTCWRHEPQAQHLQGFFPANHILAIRDVAIDIMQEELAFTRFLTVTITAIHGEERTNLLTEFIDSLWMIRGLCWARHQTGKSHIE